ncbi:ARPP-1 family domain-containing protein [Aquimarina sp. LLG6339-5]|uniref:ARPP-1 family domain-containing protein n=1 Tax=Aquimarina sp. LLG6339-5 TaxID=3160830 RepID=UPI003864C2DE
MKVYSIILSVFSICILFFGFKKGEVSDDQKITDDPSNEQITEEIKIKEGIRVQNLTLFMITGEGKISGDIYKTLSEAMNTREVTVKETGNVNQLLLDNNSDDYIFIHSGDIVKGGKQDRTISYDVIIPPKAKNVELQSFCVEQGRWRQRGNETLSSFASNTKMLSSRELKLAARHEKNQSKVWGKVAEQKDRLNDNLSRKNGKTVNVANNASNTSLQLALESDELDSAKKEYYNKFKDLLTTDNTIGYAYAINGKVYAVEIYNNQRLFKNLWDKILESIIVEAISEQNDKDYEACTVKDVTKFMDAIKTENKGVVKNVNKTTNFRTVQNNKGNIIFTTEDTDKKRWIHKSYMKNEKTNAVQSKEDFPYRRIQQRNR